MKKAILFLVIVAVSLGAMAIENPKVKEKGAAKVTQALTGMVVDQQTGEALAGVSVKIEGTDKCVFTDLDGQFEISDLNPGTYSFSVSLISYKTNSLKDVELDNGEKTALKVELKR